MQPQPDVDMHYPIKQLSQQEQEGGFWLFNVRLNNVSFSEKQGEGNFLPPPFPTIEFGCQFRFENSDHTLYLFQQNHMKQQATLQLLSQHPLPKNAPKCLHVTPATPAHQAMVKTCQTATHVILLGSEGHMANLFYLAKLRSQQPNTQTLALLHSDTTFPFKAKPARLMTPNLPPEAIGACTLLEDWNTPNRLASQQGFAGCFEGTLETLFSDWLTQKNNNIQSNESWKVIICAPDETQKKCLAMSQSYDWVHG